MTLENRETMQRAIGIIEGASWGTKPSVNDALAVAVEMLDAVLRNEEDDKK